VRAYSYAYTNSDSDSDSDANSYTNASSGRSVCGQDADLRNSQRSGLLPAAGNGLRVDPEAKRATSNGKLPSAVS
jgi:hypothetical protein